MSDEEKKAIERLNKRYDFFKENPLATNVWLTLDIHNLGIVLNLIEKQSKEIEELKENNKNLEDELNKYIVKMSDEQYRRLVNIIRDEINKLWEDKIKAKIEELEEYLYKGNIKDDFLMIRIKAKIQELQSLLEKE